MTDNLPDRMLRLMSDGRWYPAKALIQEISHRFSATKHVLTRRGYKLEKRRVEGQQYEYRLVL